MTVQPTRIVVVDDQELMRRGLAMLLGTVDEVEVIGEAADGREALEVISRVLPDAVLADARMPVMDGLQLTRAVAGRHPGTPVVILTTFDDGPVVRGALDAGAAGFLLKDSSTEDLVAAVRAAVAGGLVLDPGVARTLVGHDRSAAEKAGAVHGHRRPQTVDEREDAPVDLALLTPTERRVASFIARGFSNPEIARALVLAEGTVKNHVSAIMRKLQLHDRTRLALTLNEVGIPDAHQLDR